MTVDLGGHVPQHRADIGYLDHRAALPCRTENLHALRVGEDSRCGGSIGCELRAVHAGAREGGKERTVRQGLRVQPDVAHLQVAVTVDRSVRDLI